MTLDTMNGNIKGVLARGDDALDAMRSWLMTGRQPVTPVAEAAPPPVAHSSPAQFELSEQQA